MWNFLASYLHRRESGPSVPYDHQLLSPNLVLRMGEPGEWRQWRFLRGRSRNFLIPWEPSWPENGLSYNFYSGLLRRYWRDWRRGKAYSFFIYLPSKNGKPDTLVGGISLNDIQRGIAQKGTLGYWVGESYAHKGIMTEAASLVCDFAFHRLHLHRVEASCLPQNEPSKKLLKRLGFEQEGFAKSYLQINGKWQDHLLWGRTRPDATNQILT